MQMEVYAAECSAMETVRRETAPSGGQALEVRRQNDLEWAGFLCYGAFSICRNFVCKI